jgi:hypothetical protein
MNTRRYELNADAAFDHFSKHINNSNQLSRNVFRFLNLIKCGCFFTMLPSDVNVNDIHRFEEGGIASNLQEEIVNFMLQLLLSSDSNSLIFDDVLEGYNELTKYGLFIKNGVFYKNEAYYLVQSNKNPNFELINECLQASNAEWHCLGILTSTNFNNLKGNELSIETLNDICINAKIIMTSSYDGEGYIFWEKTSPK